MPDEQRLEDELDCEGYYGFGQGYLMGRTHKAGGPQAVYHPENQNYCGAVCLRRQACWWRHKGRVMFLLPDLTAALEGLAHDPANPLHGPELIKEFAQFTAQDLRTVKEPYIVVMVGNVEDGMAVGLGERPKDRGPFGILPCPLRRRLP